MQLWTRGVLTFIAITITASRTQVHCFSPSHRLTKYGEGNLLESKRFGGWQTCGRRFPRSANSRNVRKKARTRVSHVISKRIVGGSVSADGAWPWQVALFLDDSQVCGGSLISTNWIVSACHCFKDHRSSTDPSRWSVKLGGHQTASDGRRFDQVRQVKNIFLHPRYWEKTENGVLIQPPDFDVALLQLSDPVTYGGRVSPICLAEDDMKFPPGKTCYITGWGTTGWNEPSSKLLREAPINLVPKSECNKEKSYNGTVPHTALCAGFQDGRIDACQKDSGGPLACKYDGRWYLLGVVSWGRHCALPNKYGVYADIRVLQAWIKDVIEHEE